MADAGGRHPALRRPASVGLVAALCLLAADLVWLFLVRPPGAPILAAWFLGLAGFGAFLGGLANQVTLARAHLAAPGLIYALLPRTPGPLALVIALAGLSDVADGTIARRLERETPLGGALDPVTDGVFLGAVVAGLAVGGVLPSWLAGVVVLRYLLPAVVGGALLLAGRHPELHHTPLGQISTLLIAVLIGGLPLLRALGRDTSILLAVSETAIPVAAAATFGNLIWASRAALRSSAPPPRG